MIATPKPGTLYAGRYILSHSGIYIDVFDPKPDMFIIEDMGEGTAYCYRWGGHTKRGSKITVAEHGHRVVNHALNTSDLVAATFHDTSEGYLLDLASPIKNEMIFYKEVEDRVMKVIADKFGFKWPLSSTVKRYDNTELNYEWRNCMMTNNHKAQSPEDAYDSWIGLAKAITA